ncbi:hypothetical protein EVAR_8759_1 [Eumeta japonica]|uniref:Uncharacterized protein n=1 Tax=Eumeta variegata TaxID=151549 RepID=A0A4C1TTS3_EUMVA|nr:hypothetical protein EVAR_8759_1 [Eumeta japonica]
MEGVRKHCCVKRSTLLGRRIERDRARVNAWHSNACACYRPARALATSSVRYSNARGREKERCTKVAEKLFYRSVTRTALNFHLCNAYSTVSSRIHPSNDN